MLVKWLVPDKCSKLYQILVRRSPGNPGARHSYSAQAYTCVFGRGCSWRIVLVRANSLTRFVGDITDMKKLTALFSAVALVASVAAIAGPGKDKKPVAKATDVWTCPIQGAAVKDHSAKGVTYKNKTGTYNVHFCCAGCPETFAKLSAKDKDAKIAAALKKDASAKKGDKKG